jgi:hypothetical protein
MLATCCFGTTSPCSLGEWILVGVWSSILAVVGYTRVSSTLAMANWVGGTRCVWAGSTWPAVGCMRMTSTPSRSELGRRSGGLPSRRPGIRAPWWRRQQSRSPRLGGVARPVELMSTRLAAALNARVDVGSGSAHADAGRSHVYVTQGRAVRGPRVDEGCRPVGQSAAQLATSGQTNTGQMPMVEH